MTKKRKTGLADHVNLDGLSLDLDPPKKSDAFQEALDKHAADLRKMSEKLNRIQEERAAKAVEPPKTGFVGPDIDFDNGVHSGSDKPKAEPVKPKAVRSESAMSANKIKNAEREKAESEKKKKTADEKALKQSEELRKAIEKLTKTLMPTGRSDVDPGSVVKPENAAIDHRTKGLKATLTGALKGALTGKINPIREITSKRGIFGAVASRYAGNPNSILGNVFGALHERESNKLDERGRKDDFHTGFLTGTDRGRDLMKSHTDTAFKKIKESNPKLSDEKAMALAKKQAMNTTKDATSKVYSARAEKENELAELNSKQAALKAKGAGFELSKEELERQTKLQNVVKEIGTTGKISETDTEIKSRHTAAAMADLGNAEKGESPQKAIEREEMLLSTLQSIDAMGKEELDYLRKTFDVLKGEKPSGEALMEKANADESIITASEKRAEKGSKVKEFLGRGKDIVGKGKDSLLDGLGSILEKVMGGSIATMGKTMMSALLPLAAPLAAIATIGTGIASVGQMVFGEEGLAKGGRGTNFVNDALGGEWLDKTFDAVLGDPGKSSEIEAMKKSTPLSPEKLAAFKARQAAIEAKAVEPVPVPTAPVMEKIERDIKPEIDEKSAEVEKAKAERPVVVNSAPVSAPIITNNSTTTVVRPPLRNQEPSFNRSLQKNFV